MKILRLILASIATLVVAMPIELILYILNWLIVPILCVTRRFKRKPRIGQARVVLGQANLLKFPGFFWLFGNEEDGIDGPYWSQSPSVARWINKMKGKPLWRRVLSWSCIRNPVSNLRWSRLGIFLDRNQMEWVGNSENPWSDWLTKTIDKEYNRYWIWCRQGMFAGLWIVNREGTTYRLGSKVYPGYLRMIDRYQGLFTAQKRRAWVAGVKGDIYIA